MLEAVVESAGRAGLTTPACKPAYCRAGEAARLIKMQAEGVNFSLTGSGDARQEAQHFHNSTQKAEPRLSPSCARKMRV